MRTQLTAGPLAAARHLPVEVRPGLEEVSAGSLEMRPTQTRSAPSGSASRPG
ncbi:MAG: histidine phosphatase family protein [Janthinobacterium lividum]